MIKNETIRKINEIFKKIFEDLKYKPKLWNIDTNQLNTLKRLKNNIDTIEGDILTMKIEPFFNEANEPRYVMMINDVNITPILRKSKMGAHSTIKQYLQFLHGLEIIEHVNNFKKESVINVNANFRYVLDELIKNCHNDLVIDYISHNLNSNLYSIRDHAYSLFCVAIFELNPNIFSNLDEKYLFFEKKSKKRNDRAGYFNTQRGTDYLKKIWKDTYCSLVENIKQENLDDFIEVLYETIFGQRSR